MIKLNPTSLRGWGSVLAYAQSNCVDEAFETPNRSSIGAKKSNYINPDQKSVARNADPLFIESRSA